jgi:hypothetical protein
VAATLRSTATAKNHSTKISTLAHASAICPAVVTSYWMSLIANASAQTARLPSKVVVMAIPRTSRLANATAPQHAVIPSNRMVIADANASLTRLPCKVVAMAIPRTLILVTAIAQGHASQTSR